MFQGMTNNKIESVSSKFLHNYSLDSEKGVVIDGVVNNCRMSAMRKYLEKWIYSEQLK